MVLIIKRNVFHCLMIKNCISICKHRAVTFLLVICHVACHYSLSVCRQGLLNSPVFFSPMLSDSYKFNRVQSFRVPSRLSPIFHPVSRKRDISAPKSELQCFTLILDLVKSLFSFSSSYLQSFLFRSHFYY